MAIGNCGVGARRNWRAATSVPAKFLPFIVTVARASKGGRVMNTLSYIKRLSSLIIVCVPLGAIPILVFKLLPHLAANRMLHDGLGVPWLTVVYKSPASISAAPTASAQSLPVLLAAAGPATAPASSAVDAIREQPSMQKQLPLDTIVPAATGMAMNPRDSSSPVSANEFRANPGNQTVVQVGDRLTLNFYEQLSVDDEPRWQAASRGLRQPVSFHQRMELSGEYEVQQDGIICLPLLGAFKISDRTVEQFEKEVSAAFKQLIGNLAFLTAKIEQKPVYVLGPVKNPGIYKYSPGLTVFHLVAMSGGYERPSIDPRRVLDALNSVEHIQNAFAAQKRLQARLAVLSAERDGKKPEVTDALVSLVGQADATALLESEAAARRLLLAGRQDQISALAAAENSAKAELAEMQTRQGHVESIIGQRSMRLAALNSLGDRVTKVVVSQAATEVSSAEERLADGSVTVQMAENKIAQIALERSKFLNDNRASLERDILDLRNQIEDAQNSATVNAGAVDVFKRAAINAQPESTEQHYEIIRMTTNGPQTMKVSGTEALYPGDLIKITAAPLQSTTELLR
jgi:polysaccharide biosynthesis/export protein ExoF